ncbi:hypothetical protein TREMEDRAFT_29485 [Tremella mesenterica DSM 1558]|uniref:uncharacterized protein n=1 Tax=Tremella mesenterica (strain ATCC 24925 / CBS 8224 / DSM 1558 / NBRC 9311 / NRRL Y-6157 / RJB 2259-6 / UBC 559-6) TaxID=578456 RepID=UPI0003F49ACA|nr:uncharacterized protein TREMEDRAFT_29485 [Tremella mesenterica DSM 1558]EIW70014.1 hypothetical protein TREMEDRAFT_29485 [Tremella mesenterica DSM 1558]
MPPRRSQPPTEVPQASSSLTGVDDLTRQVQAAVENFQAGGQDILSQLLRSQLKSSTSPLGPIGLSVVIRDVLSSSLDVSSLQQLMVGLIDSFENEDKEEQVELLGEALVDVVELLEEEREDVQDLKTKGKDMDVDGEFKSLNQGEKGLELIKLLMQSDHLPSHIPNLLISPHTLLQLGLHPIPHNPQALQRSLVKRNTTLFFKQSKYNLLRESSEGFSGLIVLLTGPDALTSDFTHTARIARAKRLWGKVMSLIGYFNLSPPRVLDIILEIMACHVADHWRIFLELLRCSPWGSSAVAVVNGKGKEKAVHGWPEDEISGVASCMDDEGDRVLSQVLGVKFGFYQRQDGGDTPLELAMVAALLIKHRFISLADLFPFLSPDDIQMEGIRQKWLASISSRSGPSNALSNSVLLDDDAPSSSDSQNAETTGPPPKPSPEQRIQLLQALLSVGESSASLFILGKFPWVAQSHPAVADLILRLVAHALEGLYRSYAHRRFGIADEEVTESEGDIPAPTYMSSQRKEIVNTLLVPTPPETSTRTFEFFYPDWSEDAEVWLTIDDVHQKALRWLGLIRGLGARAVEVMVKLCRLGAAHYAVLRKAKEVEQGLDHPLKIKDELRLPTLTEMEPWLQILRISLLPALSVGNATAAFDIELWHLIQHFPYPVRYRLYGEWRDSTCSFSGRNSCPVASHAAAECTREIKKALSRVTAAQSAPTAGASGAAAQDRGPARVLAKLSHTNPCALWTTAVTQVKAYSNIGQFIVEAGRYMTQLSMDVATFTLVDTLSDDMIPRLDATGTNVAQWLESLSTFVGDFNRRYQQMDLEPILQFIINRQMRGESADLIVLTQLVSKMQGITLVENHAISEGQLQAYATGREMIREAFFATTPTIARPSDDPTQQPKQGPVDKIKSTKRSLPRLISALREAKLAIPLWIALAQTRQGAADRLVDAPLKAMSKIQDTCHEAFIQYSDLLSEHLLPEEHVMLTPDLTSLVNDFGLEYSMAFQILRPKLNAQLAKAKEQDKEAVQRKLQLERLKALSPNKESMQIPLPVTPKSPSMEIEGELSPAQSPIGDVSMTESLNGTSISLPPPKLKQKSRGWFPVALTTTAQQAKGMLPPNVNEIMSAPFFVIFWHLSISDISFSSETYQKAIESISAFEKDMSTWRTANTNEVKAERQRLKMQVERLTAERDIQQGLVNGPIRRRLRSESSKWFGKTIVERQSQRALGIQLHQYCFYPRALLTPSDAMFVAKFIRLAHDLGTVGFSTVYAYNNFFNDQLAACIFSCTESEARNLGRCLKAILADLDAWHSDEARYKKEAMGISDTGTGETLPGMLYRARVGENLKVMSWNEYRNLFAKFHANVCTALTSCWAENDYMHMHNATTVALQILPFFPIMDTHGKAIEAAVGDLISEKQGPITPDMKLSCGSYLRSLKVRINTKPYVPPSSFHSSGSSRSVVTNGVGTSTNKAIPQGPKSAQAPSTVASPSRLTTEEKVNGIAVSSTRTTEINATPTMSDPKELRRKLEEARAKGPTATSIQAKEEQSGSVTEVKSGTPPATNASSKLAATTMPTPPAGPRATRSTTIVPTSSPGIPTSSHASMLPPASLSVDEERAAARARKFGMISQPLPKLPPTGPASHAPSPVPTVDKKVEKEPPKTKITPPPSLRSRRSASVDSRISEKSRRSRRERDDRDRLKEREKERERSKTKDVDRTTRSRTPAERMTDDVKERRKQEELLQARADKLAGVAETRETRRTSRETEKEREERKLREKERDRGHDRHGDRDRDRDKRTDEGHKRKRDEETRRVDSGRRERERERERERDKDRRDERDRRDDYRDKERERERRPRDDNHRRDRDYEERDFRKRDERENTRDSRYKTSPPREMRSRTGGISNGNGVGNGVGNVGNGDKTPKRDMTNKEVLPPRPDPEMGDRIVEAPRTRSTDVSLFDIFFSFFPLVPPLPSPPSPPSIIYFTLTPCRFS